MGTRLGCPAEPTAGLAFGSKPASPVPTGSSWAAPHPHLQPIAPVSLDICAQLGQPAKIIRRSSFTSSHSPEKFPMPSSQPQTARLGSGCWRASPAKGRASGGHPAAPGAPHPMSSPSSAAPVLHVLFVPSSCWDRAACGLLPCPSAGTEPPFRSPQALPEVTILAFLFLLFCKINPLDSLCPLLSPVRLPDCVTSWPAARGARLSGGMQPLAGGDTLSAVLVPRVPWDVTGMRVRAVSPASGLVSGAGSQWDPGGSCSHPHIQGQSPHLLLAVPHGALAVGALGSLGVPAACVG